MSIPQRSLYIGGQWVKPRKGGRLDVINPFDASKLGTIPAGGPDDVQAAIQAGLTAFAQGPWHKSTGAYRAGLLRAMARRVAERKAELARLETLDNGKPIQEAEWDMDDVAATFEYYADLAEKLDSKQNEPLDIGEEDFVTKIRRDPLGVVGLITPFNYPLLMAAWKVAPALAAGNTAVLKPSEMASVTCLELAAIAHEVHLPPGVLNVITGLGQDTGAPLSSSPLLAKVAFTGSVATGRRVNLAAAQNLRPTTMELGGKSCVVVFDDADVEHAVEWVMFGIFWVGGQICSATSRLVVHERIANRFYARLKQRAEAIKICNPLEESCRLGPLVSASQHKKALTFIENAKREGATLLTGGSVPPHMSQGYFVQPTAFINVKPTMQLWQEEVFAPVLAVTTFSSEAEAIRLANDSEFGLGAAVISADAQRCQRVAEAFEAGIVWVNCAQPTFIQAPWGGVKNSGFGRELGTWGLEAFMSVKQITAYTSKKPWDWYPMSKVSKL